MVIGKDHTVETDGFSYVRSDLPELAFHGNDPESYEGAIHFQDVEFIRAVRGARVCRLGSNSKHQAGD
jgi:hypothetical protein